MEPRSFSIFGSLRDPSLQRPLALFIVSIYNAILLSQLLVVDRIDHWVHNFFWQHHQEITNQFFLILTDMGGTIGFITFLLLLFIYYFKKLGLYSAFSNISIIVGIKLITLWLKPMIARPRPDFGLLHLTTYSMPSGHAANAGIMGAILILLLLQSSLPRGLKYFCILISYLLMFLLGLSRIYLGVHYLSDVLVGILCGVTGIVLVKSKLIPAFTKNIS